MVLNFKDNNLYYYNYKIFNGQLSILLVPILFCLLYYKRYIKYFSNIFLLVFIVGIIDSYYLSVKYNLRGILYYSILVHLIGLYPLINFKKYFEPSIFNIFVYLLAIIIIFCLPYWRYLVSRLNVFIITTVIYIFNYFFYKYLFN